MENFQTLTIQSLVERGAVFYISHSGGKDSQAMYALVQRFVPQDQIVVMHADLGDVEWAGTQGHIRDNISHPLNVVKAIWKNGSEKTFLGMVADRFEKRPDAPSWPSPSLRQCTSDLKRGPLQKFMRNDMKARGATLAINCMGLRAEESTARSKLDDWKLNKAMSKAGRTVYDWLPIHDWSTRMVFAQIKTAGQEPHWAYASGNERLSCMFCIMGSDNDLRNAARQNPELARKYIDLEQRTGYGMFHKRKLSDIIATDINVKETTI